MEVLTTLSLEKKSSVHTFAYSCMDITGIFKSVDKNPTVKENPSMWSAAQEVC